MNELRLHLDGRRLRLDPEKRHYVRLANGRLAVESVRSSSINEYGVFVWQISGWRLHPGAGSRDLRLNGERVGWDLVFLRGSEARLELARAVVPTTPPRPRPDDQPTIDIRESILWQFFFGEEHSRFWQIVGGMVGVAAVIVPLLVACAHAL